MGEFKLTPKEFCSKFSFTYNRFNKFCQRLQNKGWKQLSTLYWILHGIYLPRKYNLLFLCYHDITPFEQVLGGYCNYIELAYSYVNYTSQTSLYGL